MWRDREVLEMDREENGVDGECEAGPARKDDERTVWRTGMEAENMMCRASF